MTNPFETKVGAENVDQQIGQVARAERGTTRTEARWSGIRALYKRYGSAVAQEWSKDINF